MIFFTVLAITQEAFIAKMRVNHLDFTSNTSHSFNISLQSKFLQLITERERERERRREGERERRETTISGCYDLFDIHVLGSIANFTFGVFMNECKNLKCEEVGK